MTINTIQTQDPWHVRFHDLMHFRVREILLLASNYDAFILAEDGHLTERLFVEYSELNLSHAPRITYATQSQKALELLKERRFDVVMTMVRLEDTNVNEFAKQVKEIDAKMPVVLLVFNEHDLINFPGGIDDKAVDVSFLWRGDARILLTIIKVIEDRMNADNDIRNIGIKSIIVVEDSVRYYSTFLTLLYTVIMAQTQFLMSEGLNNLHRLFRMRARPKILLAKTYEEAMHLFERYKDEVMAVISDVNFKKEGKEDPKAGIKLAKALHEINPRLAILLQSSKRDNKKLAEAQGLKFLDKNSNNLLRHLRHFVFENLGLGSFIFRNAKGEEICKADDVSEMERVIKTIPAESLKYHATYNHFSTWFYARSFFNLADILKSRFAHEFKDAEELRQFFLKTLQDARQEEQRGVIIDYDTGLVSTDNIFVRMGAGSIGGKGRGIAYISSLFARHAIKQDFEGMRIKIPKSVAIGTDEYEKFMESNGLHDRITTFKNDQEIVQHFINCKLSDEHWEHIKFVLEHMEGPLAVRSSSILEDSQFQPFAGIYSTYMLPNNHPDPHVRFLELCRAIKAVYASLFCKNAQSYMAGTSHSIEEESMAILIQEVVGEQYGDRFYPILSGVAQSYNFYPVGSQKAEEGIAEIVLGLGHAVVGGAAVLRFSPQSPQMLPQFSKPSDYLNYSQRFFYAMNMSNQKVEFSTNDELSLGLYRLQDAEEDGTLNLVGSVYSAQDDMIRENFSLPGQRLVTFNNILKWRDIPLAEALNYLLPIIRNQVGFPVEIEFALNKSPDKNAELYILQMRPLATQMLAGTVNTGNYQDQELLCHTRLSLGHGTMADIRDIVYIKDDSLDFQVTPRLAEDIGKINDVLKKKERPYFLIGPGRWGSSDPSLGIPVEWAQISGVRLIAETSLAGHLVEPSQGTHFFQNIVAKGIGYLTLSNIASGESLNRFHFDLDWLNAQPAKWENKYMRHVRLKKPLIVHLDGSQSHAVVVKPI